MTFLLSNPLRKVSELIFGLSRVPISDFSQGKAGKIFEMLWKIIKNILFEKITSLQWLYYLQKNIEQHRRKFPNRKDYLKE